MAQSDAGGFGWSQTVGMAFGAGLTVAAFSLLAWLNRRTRIARNERPPQKALLLRPAGYSLQCWCDELSEKWNFAVMQAVAAGALGDLLASGLYPALEAMAGGRITFGQMRTVPQFYLLLSVTALLVTALAWLVASIAQAARLQRRIRNCRFGLRGEQAVADRTIAAAGYTYFHDVPGDGTWNIDHVVIGPGGIFLLETKTRARRTPNRDQPDHVVYFDGERLLFPWCEDRRAVAQVQRNASWIKELVAGYGPKDMVVHPIVVVPGWYVEKTQETFPVRLMNAEYLKKFLADFKPRYTQEQLQAIRRRLEERCRNLEF